MTTTLLCYRFTYDTLFSDSIDEIRKEWSAPASLIHGSLLVGDAVTPTIESSVSKCCKNLHVARDLVDVYVVASRDFQAACINPQARKATIMISSGAVAILSDTEICYLIGHEIGHWLLRHAVTSIDQQTPLEEARQHRYAEISADRIGIVACGDVSIAAKVMLKALSGLTDDHLRFDIGSVLRSSQTETAIAQSLLATHPIMLTRLRAALLFSMWLRNEDNSSRRSSVDLAKIDLRIKRDIDAAIGSDQATKAQECFRNAEMWLDLLEIVDDGRLDMNEQHLLAEKYGQADLEKIKAFLVDTTVQNVKELVRSKLLAELEALRFLDKELFDAWSRRFPDRVGATGIRL